MVKARGAVVGVALIAFACGGRTLLDENDGPSDASTVDVRDVGRPDGCAPGSNACGGQCVVESPQACGPTCAICPTPLFGSAVCDQGQCGVTCVEGYEPCDDACCTRQITAGKDHTCYLDIDGTVYCWGSNAKGQLGDKTSGNRTTPTPLLLDVKAVGLTAGSEHTCALTSKGAVVCWGSNTVGQLGDGTTDPHGAPAPVPDLTSGVTFVDAGGDSTCALVDGDVRCWGSMIESIHSLAPTPVDGVVVGETRAISVGGENACVLTTGGGVKCWGRSFTLGSQRGTDSPAALDVDDLQKGVGSISAGGGHTCATTTSGALYCWGSNLHWQLGHGTPLTIAFSPVQIPDVDQPVHAVAAGGAHTCAVTGLEGAEGAQCWGDASKFQYPNPSGASGQTPIAIPGLVGPTDILAAGNAHTCAILQDHRVACWGWNNHGQLGDGTTTPSKKPVIVKSLPPG